MGLTTEIQVNPEFGNSEVALAEAEKYAEVIGRLPTALRNDVETVWIHKGTEPFGGGNNNLLIHIGQAEIYMNDGILEETFVHEASNTSLDASHALPRDGFPPRPPIRFSSLHTQVIIPCERILRRASSSTWPSDISQIEFLRQFQTELTTSMINL